MAQQGREGACQEYYLTSLDEKLRHDENCMSLCEEARDQLGMVRIPARIKYTGLEHAGPPAILDGLHFMHIHLPQQHASSVQGNEHLNSFLKVEILCHAPRLTMIVSMERFESVEGGKARRASHKNSHSGCMTCK